MLVAPATLEIKIDDPNWDKIDSSWYSRMMHELCRTTGAIDSSIGGGVHDWLKFDDPVKAVLADTLLRAELAKRGATFP